MLLVPWTLAGTDLSGNHAARSVAHEGFRAEDGRLIHGAGTDAVFILAHALFGQSAGLLRLLEVQP